MEEILRAGAPKTLGNHLLSAIKGLLKIPYNSEVINTLPL